MTTVVYRFPGLAAAWEHVRRRAEEAERVIDWAVAYAPHLPEGRAPVLLVDASRRPRLWDLVARHHLGSDGRACSRWEVVPELKVAVLDVRFELPFTYDLTFVFTYMVDQLLLGALLEAGMVGLVPGRPRDRLSVAAARRAVMVRCVREPLKEVYGLWLAESVGGGRAPN